MKTLLAAQRAFFLFTAASLLASCSAPAGSAPGLFPQQRSLAKSGRASDALMYTGAAHFVDVYTYPAGALEQTFTIKGNVNGMCSDSEGNVFIAAAPSKPSKSKSGFVYEYSHAGKTPIATLEIPGHGIPIACSSDPKSGNLAVTLQDSRDYAPSVAIYAKATGTPKIYNSGAIGADPQIAYGASGDLLATSGGNVAAELLKGKGKLQTITLVQTLGGVRHVQWDGAHWALESFNALKHDREKLIEQIYRVQISGSSGRVVGRTRFEPWLARDPGESWIAGATMVATPFSSIYFWAYPAGGKPFKAIRSAHHVKAITISSGE
ncbi:MAG: hypothetical protein WBE79_12855 [Candidatus Cybelea sp.]